MSTIWTPGGERPVGQGHEEHRAPAQEPTPEEYEAQMTELRQQLAETPAEAVIANHAIGMFELAALHLGQPDPQLKDAQLSIDALASLLDGLAGRLGEHETHLRDGLNQLQMAFVQVTAQREAGINSGEASEKSSS